MKYLKEKNQKLNMLLSCPINQHLILDMFLCCFVFSSVVSTYLPPTTKVLYYPHMYLLPMCLKLFLAISIPIYLTKLTAGKLLNLWHRLTQSA
jgi:hypothetical protein